jgi:hypothetical protein
MYGYLMKSTSSVIVTTMLVGVRRALTTRAADLILLSLGALLCRSFQGRTVGFHNDGGCAVKWSMLLMLGLEYVCNMEAVRSA